MAAPRPLLALKVPKLLGVDEAGRGAVLGPLVVAGVLVTEEGLAALRELGARDSKAVSRSKRPGLVRAIARSGTRGRAIVIPADVVDQQNLTDLERDAILALVAALSPDQVVVDTPVGPRGIPDFQANLSFRSGLPREAWAVFPNADRDHPAVAAASLLAKVVRDGYVASLRRQYGDFGWGYPGEPRVRDYLATWLLEHGGFPAICRTRWKCVQDLLLPQLVK